MIIRNVSLILFCCASALRIDTVAVLCCVYVLYQHAPCSLPVHLMGHDRSPHAVGAVEPGPASQSARLKRILQVQLILPDYLEGQGPNDVVHGDGSGGT